MRAADIEGLRRTQVRHVRYRFFHEALSAYRVPITQLPSCVRHLGARTRHPIRTTATWRACLRAPAASIRSPACGATRRWTGPASTPCSCAPPGTNSSTTRPSWPTPIGSSNCAPGWRSIRRPPECRTSVVIEPGPAFDRRKPRVAERGAEENQKLSRSAPRWEQRGGEAGPDPFAVHQAMNLTRFGVFTLQL
jgi:hypothetical protein